jgi:hypothetical protein
MFSKHSENCEFLKEAGELSWSATEMVRTMIKYIIYLKFHI